MSWKMIEPLPRTLGELQELEAQQRPWLTPQVQVELDQAFPIVDPGAFPLGHRVLVQIRSPKKKHGSILLVDETKETEKWNTQVAKIVSLGPTAFCNRTTLQPWPEGAWCVPGEFVRVPKYGGDRWEVPFGPKGDESALFVVFNDHEIIMKITGNPLSMKAFV